MSDSTTPDVLTAIVRAFEAQAEHNTAVFDALNEIAQRLEAMEQRIGTIARNLPRSSS